MVERDLSLSWDDRRWVESDTPWAAGCRWLQSWWRAQVLNALPGPKSSSGGKLVCSMLPLDIGQAANFLGADIEAAVAARLSEGGHSGIIAKDRLYRNLLSSQPMCFNLFGPFVKHPDHLIEWVRTLDDSAVKVRRIRFEWAPERCSHFDGGSAFDAFVEYTASTGGERFIGVECKYAENLERSTIKLRNVYGDYTAGSANWRDGASARLSAKHLRQFWLNTLLAQSLVDRGGGTYESGLVVVVAAAADRSADEATASVRSDLIEADRWLRWCPYESVLDATAGHDQWRQMFAKRYLDFGPVNHLLAANDPRQSVRQR